ncbi:hypothetical protein BH10PLA2_BH10PLA2_11550 [soil metagenome]
MYSVVLMAALTAGSAAPETWFKSHGFGGSGCCGGCYGGCYGSGCCGGYGSGCCGGCYGNRSGNWGTGCCGGCYGNNWGGCYGSSCNGCCGGCCGGYINYGSCCGGCWGSCTGCTGCYGGAIYTSPVISAPISYSNPSSYVVPGVSNYAPATTTNYPADVRSTNYAAPVSSGYDHQTSVAPAKLMINLPADAKLYVDGQLTSSTTDNRVFTTPDLKTGLTYFYDLKAEITRDGQTVTENKRVIVRSGDSVRTNFAVLEAKLKSAPIMVTSGN